MLDQQDDRLFDPALLDEYEMDLTEEEQDRFLANLPRVSPIVDRDPGDEDDYLDAA